MLKLIRIIAPDLCDVSDEIFETLIEIYSPQLSRRVFGNFYVQALANYVAHFAKLQETIANTGADSGSAVAGPITSEREGDLSRSYGGAGGTTGASSGFTGSLGKTAYGIEFLRLKKMVSVPVMTRFG